MKTRIFFILIVIIIALSLAIYFIFNMYLSEKKDNNRLSQNLVSLNQNLSFFKSRNGDLVGENSVLIFRLNEFEKSFTYLVDAINDLKVKIKRVNSVSSTVVESEKHIETIVKDSIINDTVIAKIFNYKDNFYKIKGVSINDIQTVDIQSTDSIIQVVYKGKRKRPYLWFFSKRQLEQVISSKNPNSKITYSKYIKITK